MIVHIFQYIKCEKKMNILEYEQETSCNNLNMHFTI